MIDTCDMDWHVFRYGNKRCDCDDRRNPSYRSPLQKMIDHWRFKRIQKQQRSKSKQFEQRLRERGL